MREERDPELRRAFDEFMRVPFPGERPPGELRDPDEDADLVPQQMSAIKVELDEIHADLVLYDSAVASCVLRLLGYHRQFDPSLLDDDTHLEERVQAVLDQGDPASCAKAEPFRSYLQGLRHLVEMCRERIPPPGQSWLRAEEGEVG